MDLVEIFQFESFVRGMIASSMVGILCGLIGPFIVLRNMSMIGDALSHAVLPGIVVAFMLVGYNTMGFFVGSVIAGMLTAVGITWIQQKLPTKNDAAIGIIFTAMFSIGVMGISRLSKRDGAHIDLKDFLFGNVLAVSNEDIWLTAIITIVVALSIALFYRQLFISTFQPTIARAMGVPTNLIHYFLMLLLSFAVVASLRTVGVILVVALLITPTSTALLWTDRLSKVVVLSAILGLICSLTGMYFAIQFDTTPGPAMAIVAALVYLVSAFVAPQHGIISKRIQDYNLKNRIIAEDVLKRSIKIPSENIETKILCEKLDISSIRLKKILSNMTKQSLVSHVSNNTFKLTTKGKERATQLVRAHRLWETYLVDRVGLGQDQIHDDAEDMEHIMSDDMVAEVDKVLGFPKQDPHGKLIPKKSRGQMGYIDEIKKGSVLVVSSDQQNPGAIEYLWESSINPGEQVDIKDIIDNQYLIVAEDQEIMIPAEIMSLIDFEILEGEIS